MGNQQSICLYQEYDTKNRVLNHLVTSKEIFGSIVYEVSKDADTENEIKEMDSKDSNSSNGPQLPELPISIYMTKVFQTKAYLVFSIVSESPQVFALNGKTYESASCVCNELKETSKGFTTKYREDTPDDFSITIAFPNGEKVVRTTVHTGIEPVVVVPCSAIYSPLIEGGVMNDCVAVLSYTGDTLQKENLLRIVICSVNSPTVICNHQINLYQYDGDEKIIK